MENVNKKKRRAMNIRGINFMLPSFIGMFIFSILPLFISILISLTEWNGLEKLDAGTIRSKYVGLANYINILSGGEFWRVLSHTLYYIVLYIPLVLVASLGVGLLLNKQKKGVGIFRVIYYIPVLTSWVAASLIWKWVFSPQYGIINQILALAGIPEPNWLTSEAWAMPAVVIASVWKDMGFFGLFLLSGLSGIDKSLYEAGKVDGAGKIYTFFTITLPLLTPSIFFCLVMALIFSFQLFPQIMIMTEGGPNGATEVMVERIYNYGFRYFKMGYAAAFSWLLFIIIFILTSLQMKLQKGWVHYES